MQVAEFLGGPLITVMGNEPARSYITCLGCEDVIAPEHDCHWASGLEGPCTEFWSSSKMADEEAAWYVNFETGMVYGKPVRNRLGQLRCVRGGSRE